MSQSAPRGKAYLKREKKDCSSRRQWCLIKKPSALTDYRRYFTTAREYLQYVNNYDLLYAYCVPLPCVQITNKMPRTGRGRNTRRVTPTDTGESSNQSLLTLELSSLTVAALRTRLREQNLPTSGNKAALIDRLTQQPPKHLIQQSPSDNAATARAESAPHEANSEDVNISGDKQHAAAINSTTIPANLLAQLATYLQRTPESHQVRATPAAGQASDQLSEASERQHCIRRELPAAITDIPPPPQLSSQHMINPPVTVQGTNFTVSPTATGIHKPSLPPVTPRILEKIRKGECIDFSTLTTKAMFGAPEPTLQTSFTLELTPSGDSFAIQPTSSHKRITSFPAWLECWNIYLAIRVDHNSSKASELIAYQAIITSASRQYPLHAWLNYDTQFRITAASDRTLRWDMRHSDLWFKCITPFATASQSGRFPCAHCGQTSHYPENCFSPLTCTIF